MNYIDAHVHVWTDDLERYPLAAGGKREDMRPPTFTPEELFTHCRPLGVGRVVLIQMSFYQFDNSYLRDTLQAHPGVFSGVAVIDPQASHPEQEMRRLAEQGVRGFRITPGGSPPETWLEDPGFAAMFAAGAEEGLAICPLLDPPALPALDRMCERFPETPVVIDHLARIGARGPIAAADIEALEALARHAHVGVKVSAFYALGKKKPPHDDLIPLLHRVYEAYGPDRLMWASDCPYQVDQETYDDSLALVRDRLDFLSEQDRQQILGKTAERVFFR